MPTFLGGLVCPNDWQDECAKEKYEEQDHVDIGKEDFNRRAIGNVYVHGLKATNAQHGFGGLPKYGS